MNAIISPSLILERVAAITGIPSSAIIGRRRTNRVVVARFIAIAAARQAFGYWSLADLAALVGRSDHGTAVHALARFEELCETDLSFLKLANQVFTDLFQPPPASIVSRCELETS